MTNPVSGKTQIPNNNPPSTGKKNVNAGSEFIKRGDSLPKPPTTTVANRNPNPKGEKQS